MNRWSDRLPLTLQCLLRLREALTIASRYVRASGAAHAQLLERLPSSLRPLRFIRLRLLRERTRLELNWCSWGYRRQFLERRWRRRVRLQTPGPVRELERSGRGMILASAHYSALLFLGRWLCAAGFAHRRLGVFVDNPSWLDANMRRLSDGRRLAPRVFSPAHLRRAHAFLRRGGVLIVTVDFARGRMLRLPVGDQFLVVSTGALRLAAATDAAVVPCIARERWWWRGQVSFGEPLPREWIADTARHPAAAARIAELQADAEALHAAVSSLVRV